MDEDAAWREYLDALEDVRRQTLAQPFAQESDRSRAQALFYLQSLHARAFNLAVAPRQDYPRFLKNLFFEPLTYMQNLPSPDFIYHFALVNGARRFRIHGRRHNVHWIDIQVMNGYYGDREIRRLANYDLDDFAMAPDGSFRITVSADRQPGNWIGIDPASANNAIVVRQATYDWDNERLAELHIEADDGERPDTMAFSVTEMNRRLRLAAERMRFECRNFGAVTVPRLLREFGTNRFFNELGTGEKSTNPGAAYVQAVYELREGEALIVRTEVPMARYWSIHLGDLWFQTTDFTYHQSSLNGHQARLDADGLFRGVIALADPGVPNWIDPAGTAKGTIMLRWYHADRHPLPEIERVPLAHLREHLPADTPVVAPAERAEVLKRRERASLRYYGY
ncbi:MAG: hypothetical protein AB7Q97_04545 [Gammaproteobacteria bacterium]